MRELPSIMTKEQYQTYTQEGYFTIRRSHRFWSGVFSDQTIEQKVMRTLKAPGGLAHGRGVTPSTQAKFVHAIPRCIPICHSLEDFCNVHPKSSFQHHDMQEATRVRDGEDASTFYGWISLHSPFQYRNVDGLVDVSSGIVADATANADKAFEIGQKLAENFSGMAFSEMKVKRTDKCVSIKAACGKIEVRGKEVEYAFDLLFCRVASVITSPAEMKMYMQYEFSKYASSIFEKGLMRKNTKSVLGTLIKGASGTKLCGKRPEELYIVDGGKFLKSGPWCENGTYRDVCNEYIVYAKQHYTAHAHFVMDGYDDLNSTKKGEQARRIKGKVSRNIVFNEETTLSEYTKGEFLNNEENKKNFIKLLSARLRQEGYEVTECTGDADTTIAEEALCLSQANHHPVILDASDTDIIVMLVSDSRARDNLFVQTKYRYNICEIKSKLKQNVIDHLLVTHIISGCDSVSALFRRGKKFAFDAVNNDDDLSYLDIFKSRNASHPEIQAAGERFLLKIYSAPATVQTLDELRFIKYKKQVTGKSLTTGTGFDLRLLPPTSDAAKYHCFRAYLEVQKCLGNEAISATEWGWSRDSQSGLLMPVIKDQSVAPDKVLRMISCGCKHGCNKNCKCKKAGLLCTVMCSGCSGMDCSNCDREETDDLAG